METSDLAALQIILDTRQAERMRVALERGLLGLGPAADRAGNAASRGLNRIVPSLTGIRTQIGLLIGGAGVGLLGREFMNAGRTMQGFQIGLSTIAGDATIAKNELGFLRQEADRLGQNFERSVNAYTKLTAASKGSALQGEATRNVFLAISEAATVLNLRSEQTELALRSIEQMISKGTVSAEELKQQLGDHLPGAFNLAAKAMGVTTEELQAMLEQGRILSTEFIPKFTQQVRQQFAGGVEQASQSTTASINRLANSWFELKVAVAESGLLEAVTQFTTGVTELIKQVKQATDGMGDSQAAMDAWRFSGILAVEVIRQMVMVTAQAATGFAIMGKAAEAAWRSVKKVMDGILPTAKGTFTSALDINKDVLDFMMHGHLSKLAPPGSTFQSIDKTGARGSMAKAIEFLMQNNLEFAQKYTAFQQQRDKLVNDVVSDDGPGAEIADIWKDAIKSMDEYVAKLMKFEAGMNKPFEPSPAPKFGAGGAPLIPNGAPGTPGPMRPDQDNAMDRYRKLMSQLGMETQKGTERMKREALSNYDEMIDQLDELGKKAGMSSSEIQDGFNRAWEAYQATMGRIPDTFIKSWKNALEEWGTISERFASLGADLAKSMETNITDGLMDMITGAADAEEAMVKMFRNIGLEMMRAMIQKLIVQSVLGSIGFGHAGGVVGQSIPRMHGGGVVGDEMPMVARRGEVVFTPDQMDALGKVISKNQGEKGGRKIQIVNSFDDRMIGQFIAANPDVIVNAISRRANSVRRIMRE